MASNGDFFEELKVELFELFLLVDIFDEAESLVRGEWPKF